MSRLYTALERSNRPLLKSDTIAPETVPAAGAEKPAESRTEPARTGTERPTRAIMDGLTADQIAESSPSYAPGKNRRVPTDLGTILLPPLLIDSSRSFRQDIALLYRSLTIVAKHELRSVLICSVEDGAGTSTIALNTAAYSSEEDTGKALLIEANFERPYIRWLTNRANAGFSDFLANQGDPDQYINAASTGGLHIMSGGRTTDASERLISETRVRYLLTELQDTFPFVLFDGAPINRSLGTLELAKAVDGVILVVRPNTLTSDVIQARTALANVGANTLGFAFNDF